METKVDLKSKHHNVKTVIRPVVEADIKSLKEVLDSSELFPSELLDEMISNYLSNQDSEDIWFTAVLDDLPVGIGYCAPERMTEGTFNLYAIAVKKELQGKGIGAAMMGYIEEVLQKKGARILLVETSGKHEFSLTRQFYKQCAYTQEAVIRDFYEEGDDKVVFWKKMQ